MTSQKKTSLLYRIISGKYTVNLNGCSYVIEQPSFIVKEQAQKLYDDIVDKNKFKEWASKRKCLQYLIRTGVWPISGDELLKRLDENVDDLKVKLFQVGFLEKEYKQVKRQLRTLNKRINSLYQTRHSLDYLTLDGFASTLRQQFIFLETIYCDGHKCFKNFSEVANKELEILCDYLSNYIIDLVQLRELARDDMWRSYWNISNGLVFDKSILKLTDEQKQLIVFSKMYERTYEHPECPSDEVIEDDDMFDGWTILMKRKNEDEKKQHKADAIASKHPGAHELFIPAKSKQDIRTINALNDPQARGIKKQRALLIKQKGKIKQEDLLDQKMKIQRQSNRQFIDHVKQNKGK